jgi:hypothetical protein
LKRRRMEHSKDPLLTRREFAFRQIRYAGFSMLILSFALGIGTAGYHVYASLPWTDSFLNASMILAGMGPVDHMDTEAGKLFSAFYALFSGVAFISFVGVLAAPVYHRFLHRFHLDEKDEG